MRHLTVPLSSKASERIYAIADLAKVEAQRVLYMIVREAKWRPPAGYVLHYELAPRAATPPPPLSPVDLNPQELSIYQFFLEEQAKKLDDYSDMPALEDA